MGTIGNITYLGRKYVVICNNNNCLAKFEAVTESEVTFKNAIKNFGWQLCTKNRVEYYWLCERCKDLPVLYTGD